MKKTHRLTVVPISKPGPKVWFRVHPSPEYRINAGLIELKEDNEFYLVAPAMAAELEGEYSHYTLYTAVTRQGVVRLWPVRLAGPDGKSNTWWDSAHEAADIAMSGWTRLTANKSLGAYEIRTAPGIVVEPTWPKLPLKELLRIAFKGGRLIDRPDHPVVRQLSGRE